MKVFLASSVCRQISSFRGVWAGHGGWPRGVRVPDSPHFNPRSLGILSNGRGFCFDFIGFNSHALAQLSGNAPQTESARAECPKSSSFELFVDLTVPSKASDQHKRNCYKNRVEDLGHLPSFARRSSAAAGVISAGIGPQGATCPPATYSASQSPPHHWGNIPHPAGISALSERLSLVRNASAQTT